jgi:histone-lysine N-methyltransferase SETMAR
MTTPKNTAIHTVQTSVKLGFEVLDHPAYSPDLTSSDYHLFGPLKDALRGCHLTSEEEVKEAMHEWLPAQSKTFLSVGIQKLVQCWNKCIEKHGNYVEK